MRAWLLLLLMTAQVWAEPTVTVGSKLFPESWILGDALTILAGQGGARATHLDNLGATQIAYEALKQGRIDVYPEYTGTVSEVFLKNLSNPTQADMLQALARDGIGMSYPLGFNDSYGLAMREDKAQQLGIATISDLARHPELIYGFTHEFVGRKDGWNGLREAYQLRPARVDEVQHELGYTALTADKIQVKDVYTTDAKIQSLKLRVLEDDRHYFPRYDAVLLYRADLPQRAPEAWASMQRLVGRIDEARMIRANALVEVEKETSEQAARALLKECLGDTPAAPVQKGRYSGLASNTLRHLELVGISLAVAILAGIPLGVLASRSRLLANLTLSGAGLLQTIPSLALLAFLVPVFGVGATAALVALFLYSLLPIIRNTYTGLTTIPGNLAEAAEAIGLTPAQQLWHIRLPMASPSILGGIKTSAVINVGTATLAALVGAGGLGQPILQGITLLDPNLIFQGAIPAALLALAVQLGFDLLERGVVPRGLRL